MSGRINQAELRTTTAEKVEQEATAEFETPEELNIEHSLFTAPRAQAGNSVKFRVSFLDRKHRMFTNGLFGHGSVHRQFKDGLHG